MTKKYTALPPDLADMIARNAGIVLGTFDPITGEYDEKDILAATRGGTTFQASQEMYDEFEDIDNAPKGSMEGQRIERLTATLSGIFVTMTAAVGKKLLGAADVDTQDPEHIIPRNLLKLEDFNDFWFVTDYSATDGGFIAIHLRNALSTGGFQIQTEDQRKGGFPFTFTGYSSISEPDTPPFDIYVHKGASA